MSALIDPGSLTIAETHFTIAREYRRMAAAKPRRAAEYSACADAWQFEGTEHWLRAYGRNVVTQQQARAAA